MGSLMAFEKLSDFSKVGRGLLAAVKSQAKFKSLRIYKSGMKYKRDS